RLDRSNQELARFAADAAHDLRAPLQVISGFAQLLARREGSRLDVTSQRFVASVLAAVGDMVELLDAALDQGRPTLAHRHPTPVDAGEVAARVVERLKSEIRSTKATVAVGPLPVVHTDRAQLGRLFQNLLSNALKSAPPHQNPRVTIAAERVEGGWEMSVSDQGVGVAPDDRERIFEVFERGARAYQAGGTGIGLSICKSIVERQGGRIWVEDAPTGGARFIFFLADEPV
ncbi:MAG TPA: ATP-binding protein, partial [Acidimicrobiia bacterium]|nr:ATP-binding protein [Acidimicrobiia bacterium]